MKENLRRTFILFFDDDFSWNSLTLYFLNNFVSFHHLFWIHKMYLKINFRTILVISLTKEFFHFIKKSETRFNMFLLEIQDLFETPKNRLILILIFQGFFSRFFSINFTSTTANFLCFKLSIFFCCNYMKKVCVLSIFDCTIFNWKTFKCRTFFI